MTDTYKLGDCLRKLVSKECSKLIKLLETKPIGSMLVTERIWVKKIDVDWFDWGCR